MSSNPIDEIIIGQSAPAKELKKLIKVVAEAPTSVLVLGETGTGKELVARAIHAASGRVGRLVSVNCAAIPSELLESEIFGHEKGAFTGADKPREGRVRRLGDPELVDELRLECLRVGAGGDGVGVGGAVAAHHLGRVQLGAPLVRVERDQNGASARVDVPPLEPLAERVDESVLGEAVEAEDIVILEWRAHLGHGRVGDGRCERGHGGEARSGEWAV